MDLLNFVGTVVLVTASGALAPGPLFFMTVSQGARSGVKSGLTFSVAHTLIEFTLVMLLALGLLTVASEPSVRFYIGFAGGIVLVAFGAMQIRDSFRTKLGETKAKESGTRKLFVMGLAFTGLNPFFIIWWLMPGAYLILLSLDFASLAGVVLMFICHIWMDYVWLTSVAHFAKKGMSVVGFRWYRAMMAVFGAILIYFGLTFLINSLSSVEQLIYLRMGLQSISALFDM
ncbi:MAG: LysE family transporter [Candidatus Bathyarchaeia archaeon]